MGGCLLGDSLNYFRGGDLEVVKCVNIWGRSGYIEMRSTEPGVLHGTLGMRRLGGPSNAICEPGSKGSTEVLRTDVGMSRAVASVAMERAVLNYSAQAVLS